MLTIAGDRWGRIVALLLVALTACARPIFAASCDQPLVSFRAGQLTISSAGCSLQQVLTAVGRQTGIETEMPPLASAIPVFISLGPEDPRHAFSALLEGTPFNWSLAFKEDGSPSLERVVLTEQVIRVEPTQPSLVAGPTRAINNRKLLAGQASPNKKGEATKDAPIDASLQDQQSNQPKRRADIDDSTLSKLPALPPGVPTGMWGLYPGLVGNGGTVPSGPPILPNGQPAPVPSSTTASNPTPSPFDPYSAPKGCSNCPVPPGVNPAIVNLYPSNLMQLIQMPVKPPSGPILPMAPPLPIH